MNTFRNFVAKIKQPFLFVLNLWAFRKVLWKWRWWDYRYNLNLFAQGLRLQHKGMFENSMEVWETRKKKLEKMGEAISIIDRLDSNWYVEEAQRQLGKKLIYRDWGFEEVDPSEPMTGKTIETVIDDPMLDEKHFKVVDNLTEEEAKNNREIYDLSYELEDRDWRQLWIGIICGGPNLHDDKFDGSNMKTWWD